MTLQILIVRNEPILLVFPALINDTSDTYLKGVPMVFTAENPVVLEVVRVTTGALPFQVSPVNVRLSFPTPTIGM